MCIRDSSSRVAGVDDIYYDVKMDDNMFEVALANPKTKPDILRMLVQVTMKAFSYTHLEDGTVYHGWKELDGETYYFGENHFAVKGFQAVSYTHLDVYKRQL